MRVETDESKFDKRKYNRAQKVKGQWVLGGADRGSGKTFPVAIHDRSPEPLVSINKEWICHGTTVISDCWAS
jgi:hypothetical protein